MYCLYYVYFYYIYFYIFVLFRFFHLQAQVKISELKVGSSPSFFSHSSFAFLLLQTVK